MKNVEIANLTEFNPVVQLEQGVLGCILLDPSLMDEAKDRLQEEMFTHSYHRYMFRMFRQVHDDGEPLELVHLVNRYQNHMGDIGGFSYLANLSGTTVSSSSFDHYADLLIDNHAKTRLFRLLESARNVFMDPANGTFRELLDEFERDVLTIRPKSYRINNAVDNVIDWYEKLVAKRENPGMPGMLTGWNELDRMMLGLQRTDFIIVGARTSIGKSVFALEIAKRLTDGGYKVAIFSLEMTKEQVFNRLTSNIAKVPMQAIRTGNLNDGQLNAVSTQALPLIAKIHIDDERLITAEYITSEMRRLKREHGLDAVIIDYLQEVKEPTEKQDNSGSALHRICQKIRKAAKDCDCAVVGLSQIKREVETRNDKRPFPSDLMGSGALEAVADAIILLYRENYYDKQSTSKLMEVDLAKQRNGPTGVVKMIFENDFQRIG